MSDSGEDVPRLGLSVQRDRLLGLIAETGARVVAITAPAGYGKTFLAAQLASEGRFGTAVWIDADAKDVDTRQLASMLATHLDSSPTALSSQANSLLPSALASAVSEEDLRKACAEHRTQPTCVVVDNAGRVGASGLAGLLGMLERVFGRDVCLVITSRDLGDIELTSNELVLESDDLRLTSDEARAYFEALYHGDYEVAALEQCHAASGGHPALFAVLVRTTRLRNFPGSPPAIAGRHQLARQLELLSSAQLTRRQQELLLAASLLRRGAQPDLELVLARGATREDIERVAQCIPLFRLDCGRGGFDFWLHDLGCEVFARRAASDPIGPEIVQRAISHLARTDRLEDVFSLVAQFSEPTAAADYLQQYGDRLIQMGGLKLFQRVLDRLPPSALVHRPYLLLLQAQALRLLGHCEEARRRTRLVVELAEHADEYTVRAEALMLLGRTEIFEGHAQEARRILESVLADARVRLADDARRLLMALTAVALLHCGEFRLCEQYLERMGKDHSPFQPAVLRYCRMLHAYCLFVGSGQYDSGLALSSASTLDDVPIEVRIPSMLNTATALAMMGRLRRAEAVAKQAQGLVVASDASVWGSSCVTTLAVIAAAHCEYDAAEELMESVGSTAVDEYDRQSDLLYQACWRRARGDVEGALTCSEQAREFFLGFEHAPLLSEAAVESAASLLALGDCAVAEETARELEGRMSAVGAEGLTLRARMILAECLRLEGSISDAVEVVAKSGDYLMSGNGNWHGAMYVRAFPALLSVIALSLGADRVPAHLLRMIGHPDAERVASEAQVLLPDSSWRTLCARLLPHSPATETQFASVSTPHCTVRLFGGLNVETTDGPVTDRDWRKRKARLLFTMLVVRKGKDVPREQLLEYLWPDMDEERAKSNFYVVWNNMKRALSPGLEKGKPSPFARAVGGVCRVDDVLVTSDLDEFEQRLQEARRAEAEGESAHALTAYRRLAEIYAGDLLPGDIYDDWFAPLRERCRQEFSDAMLCASRLLERDGDPVGALQLLRQALAHDAWREDLYQAALRCQIACGQRSAAIDTYMTCMQRLSEDLGLDPSVETKNLYAQVLAMESPSAEDYAV